MSGAGAECGRASAAVHTSLAVPVAHISPWLPGSRYYSCASGPQASKPAHPHPCPPLFSLCLLAEAAIKALAGEFPEFDAGLIEALLEQEDGDDGGRLLPLLLPCGCVGSWR